MGGEGIVCAGRADALEARETAKADDQGGAIVRGLIGGLIDGERSVAAIIGELEQQFPGVPELGEDIEQFMEVARAEHWIELA